MDITSFIESVKQNLERSTNTYSSEQSVSTQIVLPTLGLLGWPSTDPTVVIPEYQVVIPEYQVKQQVKNLRVDYALVIPQISPTPKCIVEVKAVGKLDADEQLFTYAFHTGVPLAILTNGREWRFYLPMSPGDYQERLVRTFDFSTGNSNEIANGLTELLSYEKTMSGESIEFAKKISEERKKTKIAKGKINEAWKELTTGEDSLLVDFLIEETSRICGYPPRHQDVIEFLSQLGQSPKPSPQLPSDRPSSKKQKSNRPRHTTYWLFNNKYDSKNYTLAYIHIMESLVELLSDESLNDLPCFYHSKYDIATSHQITAQSVLNGKWWIHTYKSSKHKFQDLEKTCAKASVKFRSKQGVLLPDPND